MTSVANAPYHARILALDAAYRRWGTPIHRAWCWLDCRTLFASG